MAVKQRWRGRAEWTRWAQAWLDGSVRSPYAVYAAAAAAYATDATINATAAVDVISIIKEVCDA